MNENLGECRAAVYPDYAPDDVLALVDLLWMALGCPPSVPS